MYHRLENRLEHRFNGVNMKMTPYTARLELHYAFPEQKQLEDHMNELLAKREDFFNKRYVLSEHYENVQSEEGDLLEEYDDRYLSKVLDTTLCRDVLAVRQCRLKIQKEFSTNNKEMKYLAKYYDISCYEATSYDQFLNRFWSESTGHLLKWHLWPILHRKDNFSKNFIDFILKTIYSWLNFDRDFYFDESGITIFQKRYLLPQEPIQFALFRNAILYTRHSSCTWDLHDRIHSLHRVYELLSTHALIPSSIMSDFSNVPCDEMVEFVNRSIDSSDEDDYDFYYDILDTDRYKTFLQSRIRQKLYFPTVEKGNQHKNEQNENKEVNQQKKEDTPKEEKDEIEEKQQKLKEDKSEDNLNQNEQNEDVSSSENDTDDYDQCNNQIDRFKHNGEACKLYVCHPKYDHRFLASIEEICNYVNAGVGIGLSLDTVPLEGKNRTGLIQTGFKQVLQRLNACNVLSIHQRHSKIAIYTSIDNECIYVVLDAKMPSSTENLENLFFGVLINDYFMECVRENKPWYLFPGDLRVKTVNDKKKMSLRDFDSDPNIYKEVYKQWVELGLYSKQTMARTLLDQLIQSLTNSGSPYIISGSSLNVFNNQAQLGSVRNLNLCAEITNVSKYNDPASCVLLSINLAQYESIVDINKIELWSNGSRHSDFNKVSNNNKEIEKLLKYAWYISYTATTCLNNVLSQKHYRMYLKRNKNIPYSHLQRREIAVTPLGVTDAISIALYNEFKKSESNVTIDSHNKIYDPNLSNDKKLKYVSLIAECIYAGAITASCDYYLLNRIYCINYRTSLFKQGIPQWELRLLKAMESKNEEAITRCRPHLDGYWKQLKNRMRMGMSNSMLIGYAPTATTHQMGGYSPSVCVPPADFMTIESSNGRNLCFNYARSVQLLRNKSIIESVYHNNLTKPLLTCFIPKRDIDTQINIYANTAPFVDHSQSTIYSLELNKQAVYKIIVRGWKLGLKTIIYYLQGKPQAALKLIREKEQCNRENEQLPSKKDTFDLNTDLSNQCVYTKSNDLSCDSCTM